MESADMEIDLQLGSGGFVLQDGNVSDNARGDAGMGDELRGSSSVLDEWPSMEIGLRVRKRPKREPVYDCSACGTPSQTLLTCPGVESRTCFLQAKYCQDCTPHTRLCFYCGDKQLITDRIKYTSNESTQCWECTGKWEHGRGAKCQICQSPVCEYCTYSVEGDMNPFVCVVCKGNAFFEERCTQAWAVYRETKAALEQQTPAEEVKLLLFVFCSWFSILSRLLQFPVLNAMVELLVKVIKFQEKQKLPCSLGTLETVRLHNCLCAR
jgi:hypothetical protein